ncbi:hypothetical protein [Aureivirga sp. CE67]|uniref:hypothetical protein n=1 Tax=Aureivirga sp. CE67 TaxID=1788983 RepID=UPI0018C94034|nr:hypothetical protein [Aureivirga sp. CE67]
MKKLILSLVYLLLIGCSNEKEVLYSKKEFVDSLYYANEVDLKSYLEKNLPLDIIKEDFNVNIIVDTISVSEYLNKNQVISENGFWSEKVRNIQKDEIIFIQNKYNIENILPQDTTLFSFYIDDICVRNYLKFYKDKEILYEYYPEQINFSYKNSIIEKFNRNKEYSLKKKYLLTSIDIYKIEPKMIGDSIKKGLVINTFKLYDIVNGKKIAENTFLVKGDIEFPKRKRKLSKEDAKYVLRQKKRELKNNLSKLKK